MMDWADRVARRISNEYGLAGNREQTETQIRLIAGWIRNEWETTNWIDELVEQIWRWRVSEDPLPRLSSKATEIIRARITELIGIEYVKFDKKTKRIAELEAQLAMAIAGLESIARGDHPTLGLEPQYIGHAVRIASETLEVIRKEKETT